MSRVDIANRIKSLITERYEVPEAELTDDKPFDDLGLDSLVLTELAIILQRDYDVILPEERLMNLETVNEFADLVVAVGA